MTLVQNVNSPPPSNQVSESLQVRIVAGRPIHCQVPGIDHHLVRWAAVRATLEAAKAIALSHLGVLYIAETDERRINRIQQVMATDQSRHSASLPFVAAGKSCQDVAVCVCCCCVVLFTANETLPANLLFVQIPRCNI